MNWIDSGSSCNILCFISMKTPSLLLAFTPVFIHTISLFHFLIHLGINIIKTCYKLCTLYGSRYCFRVFSDHRWWITKQYGLYRISRNILRAKKIFICIDWLIDWPPENRSGEKTTLFCASPMNTNLYKSVKFCHLECRSKQNVGVMFTQMPN